MTAREYLKQTSPNDKYGLRAELQKHRLRRMVEKEMELYHQAKLKLLGIGDVVVNEANPNSKEHQKKLLREIMQGDEELGLYSEVKYCECLPLIVKTLTTHIVGCSNDGCYRCGSNNLRPKEYNCIDCGHNGYCY